MTGIDIIVLILLCWGLYKGLRNGLLVELASVLSLFLGIYAAIKFSHLTGSFLGNYVSWELRYIEIAAFVITFFGVVIGIIFLAKGMTKIVNFAQMGWVNRLAGGIFGVIKTALFLAIVLHFFQKMNKNESFISHETLDQSIVYSVLVSSAQVIYPSLEEWFGNWNSMEFHSE